MAEGDHRAKWSRADEASLVATTWWQDITRTVSDAMTTVAEERSETPVSFWSFRKSRRWRLSGKLPSESCSRVVIESVPTSEFETTTTGDREGR